jgi:uncharacterized protein YndB with AHSA1/START domain
MKTALTMNFVVDKANNKINVEREFDATVDLVWKAWTTREILDQWWAPLPWKAKTKYMDFSVGGYWLYAMTGPEGEEHWARADYKKIITQEHFSGLDSFCDSNGIVNKELPGSIWEVNFINQGESTMVHIITTFNTLSDLEKTIEMGFKEGFTAALTNLDKIFSKNN